MGRESEPQVIAFQEQFCARFLNWCYTCQARHQESRLFGPAPEVTLLETVKHRIRVLGASMGWVRRQFHLPAASAKLAQIMIRQQDYARGYAMLADARSRLLYLDVLAFRVLGSRHVCMPVNTPDYWKDRLRGEDYIVRRNTGVASMGSYRWTFNLKKA